MLILRRASMGSKKFIYIGLLLGLVGIVSWYLWAINSTQGASSLAQKQIPIKTKNIDRQTKKNKHLVIKEKPEVKISAQIDNREIAKQKRLNKYLTLNPQQILTDLAKKSALGDNDAAWYIVELVKLGHISAIAPMREGMNSEFFTPLYAALLYDNDISLLEVEQLKSFGAITQNNQAWKYTLGKVESADVVNFLLENSGYGERDKRDLVKNSFNRGNSDVFYGIELAQDFTEKEISSFKQKIKKATEIKEHINRNLLDIKKFNNNFKGAAIQFGYSEEEMTEVNKALRKVKKLDYQKMIKKINQNQNRIDMFNSLNYQDKTFVDSINQEYLTLEEQKRKLQAIMEHGNLKNL